MNLKYLPFILILVSAILFGGSAAYYWGSLRYPASFARSSRSSKPVVEIETGKNWRIGRENRITVKLVDAPGSSIASYNLEIIYDPEIVRAVRTEPGGIWEEQNLLSSRIDNDIGRVTLAVGRGFGASFTGKLTLGSVIFRSTGQTEGVVNFETGTESALAPAGGEAILPLAKAEKMVNLVR